MSALAACSERWHDAAYTTGPVQSCGAIGVCQAWAMPAILRASVRPPHHDRSSMTTPAVPVSRYSRNECVVASVSEAQTHALLCGAYERRSPMLSRRNGSSCQYVL